MFDAEKVTELIAEARRIAALVPTSDAGMTLTGLADAVEALSSLRDAAEDAEPGWEYGIRQGPVWFQSQVWPTLEQAQHAASVMGDEHTVFRRVKAGPWLPVPEGNQ